MAKVSVRFRDGSSDGYGRVYFGRERVGSVIRIGVSWQARLGVDFSVRNLPGMFATAQEAADALCKPLHAIEARDQARRKADRTLPQTCAACGVDAAEARLDLLQQPELGCVRLCRDLRDCQRRSAVARKVKP